MVLSPSSRHKWSRRYCLTLQKLVRTKVLSGEGEGVPALCFLSTTATLTPHHLHLVPRAVTKQQEGSEEMIC